MVNYNVVAGDGGWLLHVVISDTRTGAPMDLTGKSAQLRYAVNGGITVQKTMTLLNQTNFPGHVEYQFLTTDVTVGGQLDGEVRLQNGLSDQLTTVDTFHLSVKTPLP